MRKGFIYAIKFLLLSSLYLIFSYISLAFTAENQHVSLSWAPIGIALALLIRWGTSLWPAITLASFASTYLQQQLPLTQALGLVFSATISIYITALTLTKLNFKPELQRQKDLYLYLKTGIITLPIVAAVLGIFTLYFNNALASEQLLDSWLSWLLGDVTGILVFATPLLTITRTSLIPLARPSIILALLIMLLSGLEILWFNSSGLALAMILVPMLSVFWIAMRSNLATTSVVILAFSAIAAFSAHYDYGAFSNLANPYIGIWVYIISMGLVSLFTAVIFSESRRFAEQMKYSIDASNIGTWDWHVDTDEYFFNNTWFTMLGYDPKSMVHNIKTFEYLLHPDDIALTHNSMDDYLNGYSNTYRVHIRLKHADGEWRTIVSSGAIIERDVYGHVIRICGTHIDITNQLKNEMELKLMHRAIESARTGLIITSSDAGFPIKYVNQAFEKITGYRRDEIIGKPYDFLSEDDDKQAELLALRDHMQRAESFDTVLKSHRKDGCSYWNKISIDPVRNESGDTTHFISTQSDITEFHKAQQALDEQDDLLRQLSEQVPGAMYQFKLDQKLKPSFPYLNDGIRKMYGLTPTQLQIDPELVNTAIHPDDLKSVQKSILDSRRTLNIWRGEYRVIKPQFGWRENHAKPIKMDDGSVVWHCYLTDITERKSLEENLLKANNRLETAQQVARIGYWSINLDSGDIYCANVIYDILGVSSLKKMKLSSLLSITHQEDISLLSEQLNNAKQTGLLNVEHRIIRNDGSERWIHHLANTAKTESGHDIILEGTIQDITERKLLEIKFLNQALTDELTGIANRRAFIQHLEQEWSLYIRHSQLTASVIIVDIDHFKSVNDKHGHEVGDKMLCHVTDIITKCIRKSDLFGRLGGEEFAILTRETNIDEAFNLANKLCDEIANHPLSITRQLKIAVTASFGVAPFNDIEAEPTDVLFAADKALYQAKGDGRNCVRVFQPLADIEETS
ncbi:diguanylate cyclase [Neptunicella sp.]|uniref:diguanylate cyclase n=1 Tax=Neptunicella sp. TaxID=2125986 RepID=UPI003F6939B8